MANSNEKNIKWNWFSNIKRFIQNVNIVICYTDSLRVKYLIKNKTSLNYGVWYEIISSKYDYSELDRCRFKITERKLIAHKKCCQKKTLLWHKNSMLYVQKNFRSKKMYTIEITNESKKYTLKHNTSTIMAFNQNFTRIKI